MLDIEQHDQLIAYLRDSRRIGRDETPTCQTLAGGVSNRTVLLTRASGEAWVEVMYEKFEPGLTHKVVRA